MMIKEQNQLLMTEKIGKVLDDAATHLTADQVSVLPYLANGMSVKKASQLTKIPSRTIEEWKLNNNAFDIALTKLSAIIGEWHSQQIQLLAIRAWDVMWEILGQDYKDVSEKERTEMAKAAQFIIKSIAPDHSTKHITHEMLNPELNISEGTVDVIARRVKELQDGPKDTIEGEYKIEDVSSLYTCHPETDFGTINYDEVEDKYQCHICGKWYKILVEHVKDTHGLKIDYYKELFKIPDSVTKW